MANEHDKRILIILHTIKLDHLPGFDEHHAAVIMIIFGAAIHDLACLKFFKPDHVKIRCKLSFAKPTGVGTPVQAEERVLRHRETVRAVHIGQTFKMLHDE